MRKIILILTMTLIAACAKDPGMREKENTSESVTAHAADLLRPSLTGDFHTDTDLVRRFIHDNSKHENIDEIYSNDGEEIIWAMLMHAEHGYPKKEFRCGNRSRAFELILRELGFHTREVNISTDSPYSAQDAGHVLTEILNPDSGLWELNDSDMDLYFTDGTTRLNSMDLLTQDRSLIQACTPAECGHDIISPEGWEVSHEFGFFEFVHYQDTHDAYINTDRYDTTAVIGGMTIFENWAGAHFHYVRDL